MTTATPTKWTDSERALRKEAKRLQKLSVELFWGLLALEGEIRKQGGDYTLTTLCPQGITKTLTEVIHPEVFRAKKQAATA